MGDQIYADHPVLIPNTKAAYRRKYKENWAERHMKGFMRSHPMYMVWDDHELRNNWDDRQTGRYANAKAVYDEYQGSHNPPAPAGRVYYSFQVGEAGFFLLDTRTYRSRNGAADNQNKTMLGADQRQALLDWLERPGLKFKFIVSSVPWRDQEATPDPVAEPNLPEWAREGWDNDDAWDGFRRERSIIFDFIREHGKGRVVLLSGDQHFASIHEVRPGLYDVNATPLGTKAQDEAATDPGQRCKYLDHRVYGLFSVDTRTQPARLEYDLYNSQNSRVASCHLELTYP